jgi:hypothetical protein
MTDKARESVNIIIRQLIDAANPGMRCGDRDPLGLIT